MATTWMDDINNELLPKLNGTKIQLFARKRPFLDQFYDTNLLTPEPQTGLYLKETLEFQSTASGVGQFVGDEVLPLVRQNVTKTFTLDSHRVRLASGPISGKEIDAFDKSEKALMADKLYTKFIELATTDWLQALHKYLLTGTIPSTSAYPLAMFQGYATLNGEISVTEKVTGVSNGLIDFAAPSAQTDTVQSLAKSSSYYWVNQYSDSSGFSGDSYDTLTSTMMTCRQRNMPNYVAPTRLFMDPGSFAKAKQYTRNYLQIHVAPGAKTEPTLTAIGGLNDFYSYMENSMLAYTEDLDVSAFSGTGANGLCYIISPESWFRLVRRKGAWDKMVQADSRQEVFFSAYVSQENFGCRNLQCNGVVTGTNK